jgi:hypothetical protein
VADWVSSYRRFWEESFDRLDDYLRELQAQPSNPPEDKPKVRSRRGNAGTDKGR